MSRLFITPREIDYISDLTKQISKDILGQKIFVFCVSLLKTVIHDVYDEAVAKVFSAPIEVDAFVSWQPEETTSTKFGQSTMAEIEVYVHTRDMIDRSLSITDGDFFTFGPRAFEITSIVADRIVYGEVEHVVGYKLHGIQTRKAQFNGKIFGPTSEMFTDPDAVQKTFVQQAGADTNRLGKTGDRRELIEKGIIEAPLTPPHEVSKSGDTSGAGNAFYDE